MKRFLFSLWAILFALSLQAQTAYEQVVLSVNSRDGIYQKGDTVKVTARLVSGDDEPVFIQVFSYGKVLSEKEMFLPAGETEIFSEVCTAPVSKMIKICPVSDLNVSTMVGFLVAPQEFSPGFSTPEDLRAYWDAELVKMRSLKPVVKTAPAEGLTEEELEKFECYKIEINMPEGNPCRGYVAWPRSAAPESLPIYLFVHSAGVNKVWNRDSAKSVIGYARKGFLALDVNAHGFLADQPQEYYDALERGELKNYANRDFSGASDYYFHNMYLRDVRALDYAVTLPVWDGRRILVHGESQGGGQALAISGIDERITHVFAIVPAITDTGALLDGRKCGWLEGANKKFAPTPLGPSVMAYHDGATLVSLFKGDLYMEAGNIDWTCDPAAVSAGFNNARAVRSKQIYYYPWRPHTYTRMEERFRDTWGKEVHSHRDAFFKSVLEP